jgi:cell wall-associated NlpC family hydrolase
MNWTSDYIGIPYADGGRSHLGCDCWGLVWLIYKEQFGIELPSYSNDYITAEDKVDISKLINGELGIWTSIDLANSSIGDLILMKYADGYPGHIGLLLDKTRMIHVHKGIDTVIVNLYNRHHGVRWIDRLEMIGRYTPR